jgi:hypothetical protein
VHARVKACRKVADLYYLTFGRNLPEPCLPEPTAPLPDNDGYTPLPGMTDAEAWPPADHRRVLWGGNGHGHRRAGLALVGKD